MASALCHELHDDNGTPDDESDDVVVGWMVMELYDVSDVGSAVRAMSGFVRWLCEP